MDTEKNMFTLRETVHFDALVQHISVITYLVCKIVPQKDKVFASILNKNIRHKCYNTNTLQSRVDPEVCFYMFLH